MGLNVKFSPLIDIKHVAFAPHRVQIGGVGGVVLDLLPQPVNLNVNRALILIFAKTGKVFSRHRLSAAQGKLPEHLAFFIGEPYEFLAALQFVAAKVEGERTEMNLTRFCLRRSAPAKNILEAQEKLSRFKRLRK